MLNIMRYNIIFIFLFVILHVYIYNNNNIYVVEGISSEEKDDAGNEANNDDNNSKSVSKKKNNKGENVNDDNFFNSLFFPFNNEMMSSPLSLFNMSPFDLPFHEGFFNSIFNNDQNVFNENLEFNVTHPKGDACAFLIEWQKGMTVENISVDVDVKDRLIILRYSHKHQTNDTETTEIAYLEEYIHPSCLLTDEVVNEQKAAFAVKDAEGTTAVQIWFPKDDKYVKSAETEIGESNNHVSQYSKSKSCVRNIRNGRCNEVTTKIITTPGARIHTRVFSSHSVPEDDKEKAESIQSVPPKVDEEKLLKDENIENNDEENKTRKSEEDKSTYIEEKENTNNQPMKIKHMSSEDDNAHMHGIDVTSPILHLSKRNWRDEL